MSEFRYTAQEEQTIFIDLPHTRDLQIKGILRGSFGDPTAIIMHGYCGEGNDLLPWMAARYLFERGIASLRLFMYDYPSNTRNLLNTNPDAYAQDFDAVVRDLRARDVPKIFGVGHSSGALSILQSTEQLDGAVLWEPTHGTIFETMKDDPDFLSVTIGDFNIGLAGPGYVIPKEGDEYFNNLGDTTDIAAGKGYPMKIISAENGIMAALHEDYIKVADEPKEHVILPAATHQLDDGDVVMLRLFEETTDWLQRYSS